MRPVGFHPLRFAPVAVLVLLAIWSCPAVAEGLDPAHPLPGLDAPASPDNAAIQAANARFAKAFRFRKLRDAVAAATESFNAGGGATALEAYAAAALESGQLTAADRAYACIEVDTSAPPDVAARARTQRTAMNRQTGLILLTGPGAEAPGGTVAVDGAELGALPPAAPLRAVPGRHTVRVTWPKAPVFETSADVRLGKTVRIKLPAPPSETSGSVAAAPATQCPATVPAVAAVPGLPAIAPAAPVSEAPPAARAAGARGALREKVALLRQAVKRLEPGHVAELLASDPVLQKEFRALASDPVIQQRALALATGAPSPPDAPPLKDNPRLALILHRIKTLLLQDSGLVARPKPESL